MPTVTPFARADCTVPRRSFIRHPKLVDVAAVAILHFVMTAILVVGTFSLSMRDFDGPPQTPLTAVERGAIAATHLMMYPLALPLIQLNVTRAGMLIGPLNSV